MAGTVTAVALLLLLAVLPAGMLFMLGAGASAQRALPPIRRLRERLGALLPGRSPGPTSPNGSSSTGRPVRPIEQVASDVRRISARYHQPGMRFAQYEGRRQAYDRVLGEAADMLGIAHLLGVLPPGRELDQERLRVEGLLAESGVLPHAA